MKRFCLLLALILFASIASAGPVLLYTCPGCGACAQQRAALQAARIEFQEVTATVGYVPVVVANGVRFVGFTPVERIRQALGLVPQQAVPTAVPAKVPSQVPVFAAPVRRVGPLRRWLGR